MDEAGYCFVSGLATEEPFFLNVRESTTPQVEMKLNLPIDLNEVKKLAGCLRRKTSLNLIWNKQRLKQSNQFADRPKRAE